MTDEAHAERQLRRSPVERKMPVRAGAQGVTLSGVEPRVELLRPNSPLIDIIVDWHWREWSSDHDDADIDVWRAGVRKRTNLDRVPFTLVAHLDGEPVGCLSVSDDDLDERFADRGPWLSGMLVIARARNLGVGRALVDAAESTSRRFGVLELWLRTETAGPFYERCGWLYAVPKQGLRLAAVMRRAL
jgi:GNAT superfamily N-acetyltransferase